MITRSAVKKIYANETGITEALSFKTKNRAKSSIKTKIAVQTPKTAYNEKHNKEANVENVCSPVFNIHIHMPTTMTSDLNKSGQFQSVIHLHFGELVHKLSPGTTSENFEIINKTAKVELPSKITYISEEQSNLHENRQTKPLKKSSVCKKLSFSGSKGSNKKNLKTEKSEAVLKSVDKIEEKEEFPRNLFHKIEFPARRSVRQANNQKLLKALKDLSANKSITKKIKAKRSRDIKTVKKCGNENKSCFSGETLNLKEPVVILHDFRKEMENVTFHNDTIESGQEVGFSCINTNDCDVGGQKKVEKLSYVSLYESDHKENSEGKEKNEKNPKKSSDDHSMISISNKFGEIYPLLYSSDSETNGVSDFLDNCIYSEEVKEILTNLVESEKDVCNSSLDVKDNCGKITKKNEVVNDGLFKSEKDKITAVGKDNLSASLSNNKNSSLNVKYNNINDDNIVSMNSKSNNSTKSSNNQSNSGESDADLSETAYSDKDNHHTASLNAFSMEKVKNCLSNENNNLVKYIIEENELSSADSDDYKEINVNTLNFQLELIKKEMKKRDVTVKKKSSKKKSLYKKEASQTSEEASKKSPVAKKMKQPKKMTTNLSAAENKEKSSSAEDFIPLQISGPTEFAVAQISKLKPYGAHKAKSFKNEMLFGKRVNRYSNPKYLETYLLKRKAAAMRNK